MRVKERIRIFCFCDFILFYLLDRIVSTWHGIIKSSRSLSLSLWRAGDGFSIKFRHSYFFACMRGASKGIPINRSWQITSNVHLQCIQLVLFSPGRGWGGGGRQKGFGWAIIHFLQLSTYLLSEIRICRFRKSVNNPPTLLDVGHNPAHVI